MRQNISINNNWFYKPQFKESDITSEITKDFHEIRIPHANTELPYNYFDQEDFMFVSCYKKDITLSKEDQKKYLAIHFEGIMTASKVYLNGEFIKEHKGGYTGFDAHLPSNLLKDNNQLTVMVDSTERADIPPFGNMIDYLTYGGIYREVQLKILSHININKVFLTPKKQLEEKKELGVLVEVLNKNKSQDEIIIEIINKDLNIAHSITHKLLGKDELETIEFNILDIKGVKLWDLDNPHMYEFDVSIKNHDNMQVKTGFRTAKFKTDGFYLNEKKIKIMGLNRHQSYPYVGYAMPARVQKKDADILKEHGLNLARGSHYPQSRHFLDRCDEIGLLVFSEIPAWQHIGDQDWQDISCENLKSMINNDYNHPSIIIWGVRINESQDNHDFYSKTNKIAHDMDKSRQTGGVRCHEKSEFLEDVYTMNDFHHDGIKSGLRGQHRSTGLDEKVPYLVTEYNGHMFPTKKYDTEERQNEHTLRHLRVVDASRLDNDVSGVIGWCAFDYNTHKDFGAGDKICHHGVFDMYRLPKWAGLGYKSQKDPEIEPILEPLTVWARGEKDKCQIDPLNILTNCDYIEFYFNNKLFGKYFPNKDDFKGLKHPPVTIQKISTEQDWGFAWYDSLFKGFVNGKEVISKKYSANCFLKDLEVVADDLELIAGDFDATRITVKAVDDSQNKLMFFNGVVNIKVSGAGSLIGDETIALIGGDIAFWVQNTQEKGDINIEITLLNNKTISKTLQLKSK